MTTSFYASLLHEFTQSGKQVVQFSIATETWLSDSIFDHEILPRDYSLYRNDRTTRGGGVLIAVSDLISSTLISSPPDLEIITVNLMDPFLSAQYVPPNSGVDYHKCLLSYLHYLSTTLETVIFVGDFNLPDICWSTLTGTSPFSNSFCDFVYEMNLSQLAMDSTHVKGNILDLVLTNAENFIYDSDSLPLIPSDHRTVSLKIKYALPPSQRTSHKYFFEANFNGLCDDLFNTDFGGCTHSDDVEYVWSYIKSAILKAMSIYIPKVRLTPRKIPNWYNPDIRHMLKLHPHSKEKV